MLKVDSNGIGGLTIIWNPSDRFFSFKQQRELQRHQRRWQRIPWALVFWSWTHPWHYPFPRHRFWLWYLWELFERFLVFWRVNLCLHCAVLSAVL